MGGQLFITTPPIKGIVSVYALQEIKLFARLLLGIDGFLNILIGFFSEFASIVILNHTFKIGSENFKLIREFQTGMKIF